MGRWTHGQIVLDAPSSSLIVGCKKEMIDLRIGQWGEGDATSHDSLASIKAMIEMDVEPADVGWSEEPARLFSIDTAMLVLRGHGSRLNEIERQGLSQRLHEARRLVVSNRDGELDFIQRELEPYLAQADDAEARCIWLAAMNALLPSPFRAASAVVATALELDTEDPADLIAVLRERLRARMGEGTLMTERVSTLFANSA